MRLDVTFACEMVWMSDKTLLAKDERLEKNDMLISVPNKSLSGTFQKISLPYINKGTSECENPITQFFTITCNKFIVLIS